MATNQIHRSAPVLGYSQGKGSSVDEVPKGVSEVDQILGVVVRDADVIQDTRQEVAKPGRFNNN